MLVVGAYGRPRLQEMVFGGVTRDVAASSPIPVLMSH
jgi:nucleotide-binding universal stress UspA family protein